MNDRITKLELRKAANDTILGSDVRFTDDSLNEVFSFSKLMWKSVNKAHKILLMGIKIGVKIEQNRRHEPG